MAFLPSKKPGMGAMLGIGGPRPKPEAPPPAYGAQGAPDPDAAMEGAEGGGCVCPSCGAPLQVIAAVGGMPEEGGEPMPDMEAAG